MLKLAASLKWKPPSENTIDFRLELRFPPSPANPSEPDFCAKPVFLLNVWKGEKQRTTQYEYFDELEVDDEEWERYTVTSFSLILQL